MTTILLADDHQLVRDTIAAYLSATDGFEVKTAQDLDEAFEILNEPASIDLAIFDYQMPGMDGLQGFSKARERYPDLKITIISGVAKSEVAEQAIKLGARGYFPKSISVTSMLNGVHRVLSGEVVTDLLPNDREDVAANSVQERFGLTARELEILEMLSLGHSNKVIADELDLKEVTVKFHVSNTMAKLGVTNRTQAAIIARETAT